MSITEPKRPEDGEGLAVWQRLFQAGRESDRSEVLRELGRRVLLARPLVPEHKPLADNVVASGTQEDWVDEQLYYTIPNQPELEFLDDALFSALQSAWPEGLDQVIFSTGANDTAFARDLIEPYLEWAERFDLPLMTDFEATEEEMRAHLEVTFKEFIVRWRAKVLEHLTK